MDPTNKESTKCNIEKFLETRTSGDKKRLEKKKTYIYITTMSKKKKFTVVTPLTDGKPEK